MARRTVFVFFPLAFLAIGDLASACGGSTGGSTHADGDGSVADGFAADGAGSDGGASDAFGGDGATCADLEAAMRAAIVKDCTSAAACAVTSVYDCCEVYTGIRADKKAAFEALRDDYNRRCPDLRGCGCQDHTETGESVAPQQPPLVVVATCDANKCTAHVK
jgi:hypothetical protein